MNKRDSFGMRTLGLFVCSVAVLAFAEPLFAPAAVSRPLQTIAGETGRDGDEVQDRELDRAAARMYDSALRLYETASYWKAARELATILDYYPAYRDIDGVLVYLGESLSHMQMYDSASRMFRYVASKHPNSRYLAQARHGLQRVYYQTGNVDESLKIYADLIGLGASEEIVDGVHYYGGLAHYQKHDYDSAAVALSKIRSRSDYFDYGLYATGLAFLKKKA